MYDTFSLHIFKNYTILTKMNINFIPELNAFTVIIQL